VSPNPAPGGAPGSPISGEQLDGYRAALGHSARLWAGRGRHVVGPDGWTALSGAVSVDFNVVVVYGDDVTTGVSVALEAVAAARVPSVIMLAGAGLGAAQQLVGAGWSAIGATPLMVRREVGGDDDPAVRRLREGGDLAQARELIGETFGLAPELTGVALPDEAATDPALGAWGLYEDEALVSCVATVNVDGALAVWSMATPSSLQRRGHGRRLMSAVLAGGAREGASCSLLYASVAGVPFYLSLGFEVVEHWQMWSRPRWVLSLA